VVQYRSLARSLVVVGIAFLRATRLFSLSSPPPLTSPLVLVLVLARRLYLPVTLKTHNRSLISSLLVSSSHRTDKAGTLRKLVREEAHLVRSLVDLVALAHLDLLLFGLLLDLGRLALELLRLALFLPELGELGAEGGELRLEVEDLSVSGPSVELLAPGRGREGERERERGGEQRREKKAGGRRTWYRISPSTLRSRLGIRFLRSAKLTREIFMPSGSPGSSSLSDAPRYGSGSSSGSWKSSGSCRRSSRSCLRSGEMCVSKRAMPQLRGVARAGQKAAQGKGDAEGRDAQRQEKEEAHEDAVDVCISRLRHNEFEWENEQLDELWQEPSRQR